MSRTAQRKVHPAQPTCLKILLLHILLTLVFLSRGAIVIRAARVGRRRPSSSLTTRVSALEGLLDGGHVRGARDVEEAVGEVWAVSAQPGDVPVTLRIELGLALLLHDIPHA